jgi:hypothetical protein
MVADGRADHHGDFTWVFHKGIARPEFAAVERYGHQIHFKHLRHARAALAVFALPAGRDARAFRKNGNPQAIALACQTLRH